MAKITNNELKELKTLATKKGLDFKPNATTAQMKALLAQGEKPVEKVAISSETPKPVIKVNTDVTALLNRLNELEKLVQNTGDVNKIKDYERQKKQFDNFAFSIKLYPTPDTQYPIVKWRTLNNYVANEGKEVDQKIEVTYLKDGEENKQEMKLVDFARVLKRSDPILAKSMKNLDGSDVYVNKQINPETKIEYYVMQPKEDIFNVTLNYKGQDLTILSTYLNA